MKKNNKKIKGYLFLIPTYIILILTIILPLFYAFIHSKIIVNTSFETITLILTILFFIFLMFGIIETIFCIYDLYKNRKVSHDTRMMLYVLLFLLNIIIVPYYYHNYIVPKSKKKNKKDSFIIYVAFLVVLLALSAVTLTYSVKIYNSYEKEEKRKTKVQQEVKTVITSNNNLYDITFPLGYKRNIVSEYELYTSDDKRNMVLGSFLYETSNYEQKDGNAILDKQIEYLKENRNNIEVYKDKQTREVDNKSIITVELKGSSGDSGVTIYKLSTLTFNNDNSKIIYIIQTVLLDDYEKNNKELNEILDSVKLK